MSATYSMKFDQETTIGEGIAKGLFSRFRGENNDRAAQEQEYVATMQTSMALCRTEFQGLMDSAVWEVCDSKTVVLEMSK